MREPFILGIGGTTQASSSTEMALSFALGAAASAGAQTQLIAGRSLAQLPLFDPECVGRTDAQSELLELVRRADGLILATPAYHGGMSALLKNAIDLLEDLRKDARSYLDRRAVGCIVTAKGAQGGGTTLTSVRTIVHALRGWPTPLGVSINTATPVFDAQGECLDAAVATQLGQLAGQVVEFAKRFAA